MTVPVTITAPPSPPPSRSDPANFAERGDAYHSWLGPAVEQMNNQHELNNTLHEEVITARDELLAAGLATAESNALTATAQATAALGHANNAAASAGSAGAAAVTAAGHATSAGSAATAAAQVLIGAVTKRPALRPSLSVDWTLRPTAAALTAAGWTISRAGEMTYFGAVPVKVAENLVTQSENFFESGWDKNFGKVTISAVTDESGLAGVKLAAQAFPSSKGLFRSVSAANLAAVQTYRIRYLVKSAEYTKVHLCDIAGGRAGASFNLATGQVMNASGVDVGVSASGAGNGYGSGYVSHNISAHVLGGGLYWCEIVLMSPALSDNWSTTVIGYPDGASLNSYSSSYTGDGTSGIEVYATQLQHNFDGDYVPTTTTAVTQYANPLLTAAANELAYQHNSRGECVGLLQYPADTNLCLQSQALGTSPWSGSEVSATATKRLWAGSASFFRLLKTTANAGQPRSQGITTSVAVNGVYTASLALLGDRWSATTSVTVELVRGSDTADVGVNADSTAVIISGPGTLTQSSGARWNVTGLSYDTPTVIRVTRTYRATDTGLAVRIYPGSSTSTTIGAAILATRVHVSASPRHMPYIQTTTAAVTRGTQSITLGGSAFAALNNPVEGTLLAMASVEDAVWDAGRSIARLDFVGSGNFVNYIGNLGLTSACQGYTANTGFPSASASAGAWSTTQQTAAYSYATNNFQLAVAGTLSTLDTAGSVPVTNQLASPSWAGLIQRTELYPRAMTSAELAAITTQGVLQ